MVHHLLAFWGVAAVVICAPGPDTALTVRNALAGGRRGGIATATGVAAGQFVWTVAASVGLAGLLVASETAFRAVQIAGAVYLLFLGAQSLRASVRGDGHAVGSPRATRTSPGTGRFLWQGLLSDLSNPKMAVFFLSLLPQFVTPGPGSLVGSIVLGSTFCVMTLVWLVLYGVVIDRAREVLLRGRVRRAVDALSGAVLTAFGIALLVEQGHPAPVTS